MIPSLYKLHQKDLLPNSLVIVGTSRRELGKKKWIESLGDYPDDFLHRLDWISTDLENIDSLRNLPDADDSTYFLSYVSSVIQT